jgi:GntR family transcriptional regulator
MTPERVDETVKVRASRALERTKLGLARTDRVVEIVRTRHIEKVPAIREAIVLPAGLFPGIEKRPSLPNSLYSLYQSDYGINIVAAHEELSAQIATPEDQEALDIPKGGPILVIERLAVSLQDQKVEWRVSRVRSGDLVYAVTLN